VCSAGTGIPRRKVATNNKARLLDGATAMDYALVVWRFIVVADKTCQIGDLVSASVLQKI
jgi:hypothetical protein